MKRVLNKIFKESNSYTEAMGKIADREDGPEIFMKIKQQYGKKGKINIVETVQELFDEVKKQQIIEEDKKRPTLTLNQLKQRYVKEYRSKQKDNSQAAYKKQWYLMLVRLYLNDEISAYTLQKYQTKPPVISNTKKRKTMKRRKKSCSNRVKCEGIKRDGTLKKGYRYAKGGRVVKAKKK